MNQSRVSSCLHGYLPLRPWRLCGETQDPGQLPGPPKEGFSPRAKLAKAKLAVGLE